MVQQSKCRSLTPKDTDTRVSQTQLSETVHFALCHLRGTNTVHLYTAVSNAANAAAMDVGQRPLACLDSGFEYRRSHGFVSLVSVVCSQVEVSAWG
jgi:hypothetical protein